MKRIATIVNDFPDKFGLPRQSGIAPSLVSRIVFEPEYRCPEALRGLDGFSHLWLIWCFSEAPGPKDGWSPTVRPPRLGGNARVGVFATRSPNRPNPIGLSCVQLLEVDSERCELVVAGADLMSGTPIYDIKPYLPQYDSHPEASSGFVGENPSRHLPVEFECTLPLIEGQVAALGEILSQDPRPAYHDDPSRVYTMAYAGLQISFRVEAQRVVVTDSRPITSNRS